jgi:hypothetical protein
VKGVLWPEGVIYIGVNDVAEHVAQKLDYLVLLNNLRSFRPATRQAWIVQGAQDAKAVFTQVVEPTLKNTVPIKLSRVRGNDYDFDNKQNLNHTSDSPHVAVCLAVHLGCKRIGMLGVDFIGHRQSGRIASINAEYLRLYNACKKRGVQFVNLSQASLVDTVPHMPMYEFVMEGRSDG